MRELLVRVGKFTLFCHRWLGVALCVLFLLWFPSGIVMMYRDFPSVSPQDRLDRSPALEASAIRLSPAEAYARLNSAQPPAQVRLNVFDGRPVYRFRSGREERVVYADTGEEQTQVSFETIRRIATAWTGQPLSTAKVQSVEEADQWTVQGPLRSLRPMWKYSWSDGEHRRGCAVHDHQISVLGLARGNSSLAVFHSAADPPAAVEPSSDLVFGDGRGNGDAGNRNRNLDVFAP
jgi:hypothetical protein